MHFFRKVILTVVVVLVSVGAFGQYRKNELNLIHYEYSKALRFGFTLGVNVLDFSTVNTLKPVVLTPASQPMEVRADVVTMKPGFSINAIADYRLNPFFNIRVLPGICFGSRELHFYSENDPANVLLYNMPIASNYIELPVHLKYSAIRYSNFRPYIFGGANFRSNLTHSSDEKNGVYFGFNQFEPFYEFGFGFDSYFYFFKLSVELKISKGFQDVLADRKVLIGYQPYLDVIDKMNSQMIQLSLHFE